MALSARPKLHEESAGAAGTDEAKSEDRLMTDVTAQTFIEILDSARQLANMGLDVNMPTGEDGESREALADHVEQIEVQLIAPLRALIEDLTNFVEEVDGRCTDVTAAVDEAGNASDEYDEAVNEVQDHETGEGDDFDELQNEETEKENAMTEADQTVADSRQELIDAIDTLVENIGAPESQA